MKRVLIGMMFALSLLAAGLVTAQDATPETTPEAHTIQLLFAQSARGGSLTRQDDGSFLLVLENVGPTLWFTDRPGRQSGHVATAEFVALWAEGSASFEADPPNAALQVGEANYAFELTAPVYDADTRTLTYTVTPLEDETVDVMVESPVLADEMTFEMAALFIDDFWDTTANVIDRIIDAMCPPDPGFCG